MFKNFLVAMTIVGLFATCSDASATEPFYEKTNCRIASKSTQEKLSDGVYLILREGAKPKQLKPLASKEQVLINDYEFLDPADKGEVNYIVVTPDSFIPFAFAKAPEKGKDDKGRSKLLLTLADDQVKPLEEFTEKNCGKSVAIVIGGKVVTTHKIREAIKGGQMQITRCSDFGCEVLYTQLQKQKSQ